MADLVAGDVTYSQQPNLERMAPGARSTGKQLLTKVTFGDGAKTVGTAGIPLVVVKLGVPTVVKRLRVIADSALDAVKYIWNGNETSPALMGETTTAPAATTLTLEVEGY